MHGQGMALPLTKRLFGWYKDLDDRGSPVLEVYKLRHLRRIINVNMTNTPWHLNKWRDKVDAALQAHSDNGTALSFAHWTTILVNGKATFKLWVLTSSICFVKPVIALTAITSILEVT